MGKIRDAAQNQDSLMPVILEAVKADVTMGEIMQALKDVWGEYQEEPIY